MFAVELALPVTERWIGILVMLPEGFVTALTLVVPWFSVVAVVPWFICVFSLVSPLEYAVALLPTTTPNVLSAERASRFITVLALIVDPPMTVLEAAPVSVIEAVAPPLNISCKSV